MLNVGIQLAEPKRLKQLQIHHILDTPQDEAFDRMTRLAAHSLCTPIALVTFVDERRQWFKSTYGLRDPWASWRETPLSHSFCQYVVAYKKPLVIVDARKDPLVQKNLAIQEMGVVAYLGAPIIDHDGSVLGSFAVIDSKPRSWSHIEVQMVEDFAALTMPEVLRVEVAQRHTLEETLSQTQRLEAIGKLAGGVAHDFNNILLIIDGYASLLEAEMAMTSVPIQYVREIKKAAERASSLTRQLLAFGCKQVLKTQCINLNLIIHNLESRLKRSICEDVKLQLDLCSHLHMTEVDPGQLEQVLLNLIINARDATPTKDLIQVATRNRKKNELPAATHGEHSMTEADDWIELKVKDGGSGMDADTLSHIFEPFYTTKTTGKGTGLSLAAAYGIIRQSGGYVHVETQLGIGSTFHIFLPATTHKLPVTVDSASKKVRQAYAADKVLLLVDDDVAVRKLLHTVLQQAGYQLIEAGSALEALQRLQSTGERIHMALLDLVMPGMNGRELGENLQQLFPGLQILYMSGYNDDLKLRHDVQLGRVNFVQKPVAPEILLQRIAALLDKHESAA